MTGTWRMAGADHLITDEAELETVLGAPMEYVRGKILPRLNEAMIEFIRRAPLIFVSTIDARGQPDVSPKGDPDGFVEVDGAGNLLIPERPGNNLTFGFRNILRNGMVGLIFVGGLLLIWVAWKMWRELREGAHSGGSPEIEGDEHSGLKPAKSFAAAAWAVAVADVSMSLDNVLAVAGAAREHPGILIVGLIFAVALMGLAANVIAKYIERYRWIAYIGLAVILYVAVKMIYEGWIDPGVGIGTLFG